MRKVAIVTDSTAYLPTPLLDQYKITVVPLMLIWADKTYQDGVDMKPGQFYNLLPSSRTMPTTSQPAIPSLQGAFTTLLEQGYDVLGMFISSRLSGTYECAIQARDLLPKDVDHVAVVDSLATTLAMGLPLLTAARAAEAGESLTDVKKIAEQARDNTGVYFVVDTLEYLRRGGRIGGAQSLLGNVLNIKPLLNLQDGRIESVEKIRTKGKALARMLDLTEEKIGGRTPLRVGVVHANAEQESLVYLETVKQRLHPAESLHSILSPVIGSHVGPGTISLAYMTGF